MKDERQNKTPIKQFLSTKFQFLTNTNSFLQIFSLSINSDNPGKSWVPFSCSIK